MRVLVTWGSKRGGTEGIARVAGRALSAAGLDVQLMPARKALHASGFDAVIVGGALYTGLWHADARRFVVRRAKDLRRVPVWFFSSGPLDDSADRAEIPPIRAVETLMERVGALGHATFGGRLAPDARGFPAAAMAKTRAGDWRNEARVEAWAEAIARALPTARPRPAVLQPGRSVPRLLAHAVFGWAAYAAIMAVLLRATSFGVAATLHAIAAPVVFALVARHYFRARGAREALPTAFTFVAVAALLDLAVICGLVQRDLAMFASIGGTWLPLAFVFAATWLVGHFSAMTLPPRETPRAAPR